MHNKNKWEFNDLNGNTQTWSPLIRYRKNNETLDLLFSNGWGLSSELFNRAYFVILMVLRICQLSICMTNNLYMIHLLFSHGSWSVPDHRCPGLCDITLEPCKPKSFSTNFIDFLHDMLWQNVLLCDRAIFMLLKWIIKEHYY